MRLSYLFLWLGLGWFTVCCCKLIPPCTSLHSSNDSQVVAVAPIASYLQVTSHQATSSRAGRQADINQCNGQFYWPSSLQRNDPTLPAVSTVCRPQYVWGERQSAVYCFSPIVYCLYFSISRSMLTWRPQRSRHMKCFKPSPQCPDCSYYSQPKHQSRYPALVPY